ncbi:hypothetical protein SD71_01235 [Cohnella kolymensis]|uniref:Uncharacterized protein n=1 Tax=Cohnella kolymensis TaxID=1590652 RepID=A0ABR5A8L5_9BACL|nr:hypothetical protein [Cohnella kolymensis]KIL37337.1 hypothetical protein SD71_01235 [Cohnella kolymensis]
MNLYTADGPEKSESLSLAERLVLNAVLKQKANFDDVPSIAKACSMSETQAGVAVQLLTHKKLFPQQ